MNQMTQCSIITSDGTQRIRRISRRRDVPFSRRGLHPRKDSLRYRIYHHDILDNILLQHVGSPCLETLFLGFLQLYFCISFAQYIPFSMISFKLRSFAPPTYLLTLIDLPGAQPQAEAHSAGPIRPSHGLPIHKRGERLHRRRSHRL